VFLPIFTLLTRVPAFQHAGGLSAARWGERDDETDVAYRRADFHAIGGSGMASGG